MRAARRTTTLWVGLALVVLPTSRAAAGNGDGVLVGNEAAMTGGAVTAVVTDGSGTWYNPAGLASIPQGAVDMSGSIIQLRAAEEGGLISSTTGESNDGGYVELNTIPSAVTLTRRLDPNVTLGLGVFVPRFTQHTTRTSLGEPSDQARWAFSSNEFRATYHAGAGLGLRIDEHLRVGFSLFGVYRERSDSFQSAGTFSLPAEMERIVTRGGIVQVRSLGLELGVGFQWEPQRGVIIAFTARSPGLELLTQLRTTTAAVDATVRVGDDLVDFSNVDAESLAPGAAVLTAGRFNLSLGHRFSRGWIAGEIDVQPPIQIDPLVLRRLVWNVRVGGRYQIDREIGIGAGLFTDLSEGAPIAELGQTQVDFYGLSLGFEYRTPHRLAEGEPVDTLVFSTTAALRYAIGIGSVGGLLFDPDRGTARDTVRLHTTIHEIGLHLGSALYF